jgi:hypothetical protein
MEVKEVECMKFPPSSSKCKYHFRPLHSYKYIGLESQKYSTDKTEFLVQNKVKPHKPHFEFVFLKEGRFFAI